MTNNPLLSVVMEVVVVKSVLSKLILRYSLMSDVFRKNTALYPTISDTSFNLTNDLGSRS